MKRKRNKRATSPYEQPKRKKRRIKTSIKVRRKKPKKKSLSSLEKTMEIMEKKRGTMTAQQLFERYPNLYRSKATASNSLMQGYNKTLFERKISEGQGRIMVYRANLKNIRDYREDIETEKKWKKSLTEFIAKTLRNSRKPLTCREISDLDTKSLFSKPDVNNGLNQMVKKGIVEKVPLRKTKKFRGYIGYSLVEENESSSSSSSEEEEEEEEVYEPSKEVVEVLSNTEISEKVVRILKRKGKGMNLQDLNDTIYGVQYSSQSLEYKRISKICKVMMEEGKLSRKKQDHIRYEYFLPRKGVPKRRENLSRRIYILRKLKNGKSLTNGELFGKKERKNNWRWLNNLFVSGVLGRRKLGPSTNSWESVRRGGQYEYFILDEESLSGESEESESESEDDEEEEEEEEEERNVEVPNLSDLVLRGLKGKSKGCTVREICETIGWNEFDGMNLEKSILSTCNKLEKGGKIMRCKSYSHFRPSFLLPEFQEKNYNTSFSEDEDEMNELIDIPEEEEDEEEPKNEELTSTRTVCQILESKNEWMTPNEIFTSPKNKYPLETLQSKILNLLNFGVITHRRRPENGELEFRVSKKNEEEETKNLVPPPPPLFEEVKVPKMKLLRSIRSGKDGSLCQVQLENTSELRIMKSVYDQEKKVGSSCIRVLQNVRISKRVAIIKKVVERGYPEKSVILYENFDGSVGTSVSKEERKGIADFLESVCLGILALREFGVLFFPRLEDILYAEVGMYRKRMEVKILLNENNFKFVKIPEDGEGDDDLEYVESCRKFVNVVFSFLSGKDETVPNEANLSLRVLVGKVISLL